MSTTYAIPLRVPAGVRDRVAESVPPSSTRSAWARHLLEVGFEAYNAGEEPVHPIRMSWVRGADTVYLPVRIEEEMLDMIRTYCQDEGERVAATLRAMLALGLESVGS